MAYFLYLKVGFVSPGLANRGEGGGAELEPCIEESRIQLRVLASLAIITALTGHNSGICGCQGNVSFQGLLVQRPPHPMHPSQGAQLELLKARSSS